MGAWEVCGPVATVGSGCRVIVTCRGPRGEVCVPGVSFAGAYKWRYSHRAVICRLCCCAAGCGAVYICTSTLIYSLRVQFHSGEWDIARDPPLAVYLRVCRGPCRLQLQAEATGCTVSCTVFAPSAWVSALPPTLSLGRAIDTDWTLFYLYLSTSTSVSETGGSTHFSAPTAHASDLGVIGPFHGSGLDKGGSVAHPPVSPAT